MFQGPFILYDNGIIHTNFDYLVFLFAAEIQLSKIFVILLQAIVLVKACVN